MQSLAFRLQGWELMDHLTVADLLAAPAARGQSACGHEGGGVIAALAASAPDFIDCHPRFRQLNDYLVSRAPEGSLPGRQHIDPTDIPGLLSVITFVDVERDGDALRLRFRLVGTTCTEGMGRDLTGEYIDESHVTQCGDAIAAQMTESSSTASPDLATCRSHWPDASMSATSGSTSRWLATARMSTC